MALHSVSNKKCPTSFVTSLYTLAIIPRRGVGTGGDRSRWRDDTVHPGNVQASLNSLAKVCEHTYALRQEMKMKSATVFADEDVLRRLRKIAKREQTTLSEIVRTAPEHYAIC